MSLDTYIYIEANDFPEDAWRQACDEFGLVENSSKKFYVDVHDSFGLKVSHSALAESHVAANTRSVVSFIVVAAKQKKVPIKLWAKLQKVSTFTTVLLG